MAFDEGRVYGGLGMDDDVMAPDDNGRRRDPGAIVRDLKEFVQTHFAHDRRGADEPLAYRQQLNKDPTRLVVDLVHVRMHNPSLGAELEAKPAEYLPLFERACREVLREDHQLGADGEERDFGDVQVMLTSSEAFGPSGVRDLSSERVTRLVQLPGIVTSAAKPRHKATYITIQCKDCRAVENVPCRPGLGGAVLPKQCNAQAGGAGGPNQRCSYNSYVVLGDRSRFVDQQTLKLQERPEDVPTGELPRTLLMVADRHLVGRVAPGARVRVTGIYCTHRSKAMDKTSSAVAAALQQPYLRVVGIVEESDARADEAFSNEEIARFERLAGSDDVYERHIFPRIAPQIFGSQDIKQAIACLLFGGARKVMPDGTSRRGDINVLLLGDPSTAKSQFLKFVDRVAPICVYTSGKGSSAAGLTAAVVQDAGSREFYLEGGAMVLADGGVVCIDEFDKMRPEDRVAIHEAMEQQTISIAKAGITTVLKSRTSVLAAANPPSGRYDDLATASENIDLQSTILSRFDLIFIVRDAADADRDAQIARHVLRVHAASTSAARDEAAEAEERFFKRYIHYCRTHCFPRLSEAAREALVSKYVDIRERARGGGRPGGAGRDQDHHDAGGGHEESPIPITVRQLEALIRISESLARMALKAEAGPEQVEAAYRLFYKSTVNAMNAGLADVDLGEAQVAQTRAVEERIRDRVPLGGHLGYRKLMDDLMALGCSPQGVGLAVKVMLAKGELKKKAEGKLLQRVR